jgi:hypothetical protein
VRTPAESVPKPSDWTAARAGEGPGEAHEAVRDEPHAERGDDVGERCGTADEAGGSDDRGRHGQRRRHDADGDRGDLQEVELTP